VPGHLQVSATLAGAGAVAGEPVGNFQISAGLAGAASLGVNASGASVRLLLPIYPGRDLLKGLAYSQKWSPTFYNAKTATTATGADIDLALAQYPLHDFELNYEFLRDTAAWGPGVLAALEFKTMMGFHLALAGTVGRFFYKNYDDWQVFQNQIGVGDGVTTLFTLTRTFGANGYYGTEPIGGLDMSELFNVYLNGSSTPVNPSLYLVDTSTAGANTIRFATAPAAGYSVNVDMSYYYYCKLATNSNTFEKFMHRIWNLGKVALHSCRPGA